jgi:hypothetical protein
MLFTGIGPPLWGGKQDVAAATYNCDLGKPLLRNGGMIFQSVGFADPVN